MGRPYRLWQPLYLLGLTALSSLATACTAEEDAGEVVRDAPEASPQLAASDKSSAEDPSSPCFGGTVGMDSDSFRAPGLTVSREYAAVKYMAPAPNQLLSLKTTMQVPALPKARQTLFVWPGVQSKGGSADPANVGNGVLQPVLTWGPSCAPRAPRSPYAGWWMAAMYVNVTTRVPGLLGCLGGDYMMTEVGDLLEIDMSLRSGSWVQTVTDLRTKQSVDLRLDLKGQVQNIGMWVIEVPSGLTVRPAADVVFTKSVLTFSSPVKSCQPTQAGSADAFSAPVLSRDGLHCCYDEVVLRADRGTTR